MNHIPVYRYCANQRDTFTSENPYEQTATRMFFKFLAKGYGIEVLRDAFVEALDEAKRKVNGGAE